MFGIYRLALASLVALGHMGWYVRGLEFGAYSVIGFYMLSGLLMHLQFQRFQQHPGATLTFYVDRFLRVLPVYWAVCLLVLSLQGGTDLFHNFALLPLSYENLSGAKSLIFVAWSLATEFHFYLLLPLLFVLRTPALKAVMWLSFGVFAASPFLPNSTWWAYYGTPGTLFVFVSGMLLARRESLKTLLWANGLLAGAFVAGKLLKIDLPSGVNISVSVGLFAGAAIIPALARKKPGPWDTRLGLLTLPLFLCHPLVLETITVNSVVLKFMVSLLLALALTLVIEKPFDGFRYFVRKRLQGRQTRFGHVPLSG